jgi:hypothetical protein
MYANHHPTTSQLESKPLWQAPRIETMVHITEIVRGGGGKLSLTGGDPGESRKEKGSGR